MSGYERQESIESELAADQRSPDEIERDIERMGNPPDPYWVLGAGDCSGFGGRARSRLMLAPPKKDAPFRSTT